MQTIIPDITAHLKAGLMMARAVCRETCTYGSLRGTTS